MSFSPKLVKYADRKQYLILKNSQNFANFPFNEKQAHNHRAFLHSEKKKNCSVQNVTKITFVLISLEIRYTR